MSRPYSALILLGILVVTAPAQDVPLKRTGERSDYISDASYVFAKYQPKFGPYTAESMAAAGKSFVAALGNNFRSRGALPLNDGERRQWTNLPPAPDAGGVRLGELDDTQLHAVCDLLAALLSPEGYEKFVEIMWGDDQLRTGNNRGMGTQDFSVMVFGEPSATELWAFQLDGHHLGINLAVRGEAISLSPSFVGAQPEKFTIAGTTYRPFAGELDDAYALIGMLGREQREAAVLGSERMELRAGPGRDGQVPESLGTPCSTFDQQQRTALLKLISHWVGVLPAEKSAERMKQLEAEIDQMKFAWNGEIDPRSPMSYAIQGPTLLIEFCCQGRGDRPLDHLHSMYRDPTNEYGAKLK